MSPDDTPTVPGAIAPGTVQLWGSTFADLRDRAEASAAVLSDDERRRAQQLRSEDDRLRFVLARAGLRTLLAEYTGTRAADVELVYGSHGRPGLRPGTSCVDVRFSVAHSDTAVMWAFAVHRDVGVDLEPLVPPDDGLGRPEVYRRMLTPVETGRIEELPAHRRARAVLALWVRKEAVLKALGTGLRVAPDAVDVTGPCASFLPVASVDAPGSALPIRLVDFAMTGHLGAVALSMPGECI